MCFSPQADLVGGSVVAALGVDAVLHLRRRHEHIALAALPLVLGLHQLDEAFIWWSLQGHLSQAVGRVALWIYLTIAFVLLPVFVPFAVAAIEPRRGRRRAMAAFVAIGLGVAIVLGIAMVRGPMTVRLRPYHLSYGLHVGHAFVVIACYVAAVCGALLCSSYRHVVLFGLVNLVAIVAIARLTADGFASVWCGWAAVSAGAISAHMRWGHLHRALPYALS